uniref:Uncharacterized protein n=1 Tax=Picea glauca TaxID=3330 RepID=A0A124GNP8_PICGL|nr:hypothetical protein ABT39_MTgene2743 [Picea glauca]
MLAIACLKAPSGPSFLSTCVSSAFKAESLQASPVCSSSLC